MRWSTRVPIESGEHQAPGLPALLLYALGLGAYFILRFGGNWMEIDTSRFIQSAQAVLQEATLAPSWKAYPHGFNYPVAVVWLAHLTGFTVPQLQALVLPIVGIVSTALVAWVFFVTVLGTKSSATLAAMLYCLQADTLFVITRGTHEKLTWTLAMMALFALYRSARDKVSPARFAAYVAVFYLSISAMISGNAFFASTLVTAIVVSLLLGLAINRLQVKAGLPAGRFLRLALISAASMAMLYLFLFYLYPPSMAALRLLPTIVDKTATLFLGFEPQADPYAYTRWAWTSRWVYAALSLFTWLLLLGSLAEWIRQARRFVLGERLLLPAALPWLLYAGFAAQIAVAVLLDYAGALSSNLQLRILPGLVIFASILGVQGLEHLSGLFHLDHRPRRILYWATAVLVLWFSLASLLKTTNDPSVSNKWGFYHRTEKAAMQWTADHTESAVVWAGIDERLFVVYSSLISPRPAPGSILITIGAVRDEARYLIFSEVERLRHLRLGIALPTAILEDRLYDAGWTQVYRKRPQTPYQDR